MFKKHAFLPRPASSSGQHHTGLSRRIYLYFLIAAVLPTAIAGVIGVAISLDTLRTQTLTNLNHEMAESTGGIQLMFDQIAAEAIFLSSLPSMAALLDAVDLADSGQVAAQSAAIGRDFARLCRSHPYIYQIRVIDAKGMERVRVEKRDAQVEVVPAPRLQDQSDSYYVREALARKPGELYVSPLDLNKEFGRAESPERPTIRVATVITGRDGAALGLVVINLHANVVLRSLQEMLREVDSVAYLFDRSGQYLIRSMVHQSHTAMRPIQALQEQLGASVVAAVLGSEVGTVETADHIIAHAPVDLGAAYAAADRSRWVMAQAFPKRALWQSVFNLYLLYGVLLAALAVTAVGGYRLCRRLLGPLEDLKQQAEALTEGNYTRRVRVSGRDEIAALGLQFNTMAERLAALHRDLEAHRASLADDVASRTRELAAERALLASVFRHTSDAILAIDTHGDVMLANAAAHSLLGLQQDLHGTRMGDALRQCWQLIGDVKAGETLRCDVTLAQHVLAVSVDASPADGQRHTHVIVARDVSKERLVQDERRQLDRQMFQMEKMATMGELAIGIAHEIGNPLAGMKAVVQLLQFDGALPAQMYEPLRRLEAEIDRLSDFLHSFRGFAITTAPDLQPVCLQEVITDVMFWTGKDTRAHGVKLVLDLDPDLPAILADVQQLKQVLLNLVVNALHAMPHGGRLTLAAHATSQGVRIEVQDTGVGIAAHVQPHIFDTFYTTRAGGSGLGLSITAKIVREHGARIDVESALGAGARFVLVWPSIEWRNDERAYSDRRRRRHPAADTA